MNQRFQKMIFGALLAGALSLNGFAMQAPAAAPAAPAKAAKAAKPAAAPTDQEIADAKAKGLVWVNTSSKAYHKSDDKYFGKTKHGKFMTEDEAKTAGNHLSGEKTAKPAAAKK